MSRFISTGIDIGSHTTRVVIAEAEKEKGVRRSLRIIGTGEALSRGVRHGYCANVAEAAHSVREAVSAAEKNAKMRIKNALLSVGGVSLEAEASIGGTMISRVDEEIASSDVERAARASEEKLKLRNKKILHRIPLSYRIDDKEILGRPQGMHGRKLESKILFVTCLDQHLDDFIAAVEEAGVRVDDVAAAPVAASLVTLTKPQRIAGAVLVNIGSETVSVAVFEDEKIVSLQVIPIGSGAITNDIALGLRISLEEAEDLKTRNVENKFPQKKLDDIVQARLDDIFDVVKTHLKKIGRNEFLPAGIVMTGGGAKLVGIEDIAKEALRLPARVVQPRAFGGGTKEPMLDTSWAVAYGLCILGFDDLYASDFSQMGKTHLRSHVRDLTGWMRQFLP